ncbi:hypothetical protein K0M31_018582 [Melipona bicolor]|uniref:Uncharacterized protein n=1 Tax=Melipona bicolor TaxID=60889 RepID=A0AA40KRT2_9HYME|nr:hypothetical protein K0M31_018582 [Melipona bicolor]
MRTQIFPPESGTSRVTGRVEGDLPAEATRRTQFLFNPVLQPLNDITCTLGTRGFVAPVVTSQSPSRGNWSKWKGQVSSINGDRRDCLRLRS